MANNFPSGAFFSAALPSVPKSAQSSLPRSLYRYVWRVSAPQQMRLIVLTFAVFPLSMVPLEFQRRMVDNAVSQEDLMLILWLALAYLAVVFLHAGLKYALNVYQGRVAEGVIRLLRRRIARFGTDSEERGHQVSMMATEAERVGGFVGEALSFPLLHGGIIVAIIGYMLVIEPLMAAVSIVLLAPAVLWAPPLQRRINEAAERWTREMRSMGDVMVEDRIDEDAVDRNIDGLYRCRNRFYVLKFMYKQLNNLIGHMGPLAIVLVGGWMVIEGRTEVGTIVAFLSGFERIVNPSRQALSFYRRLSQMRVQYGLVREAVPAKG